MQSVTSSPRVETRTAARVERTMSYVEAIREATALEMRRDPRVILFGLDVDDPKAIQGTTRGLPEEFGAERVFGTPLSEDAMTGAAIGMALAGLRPIHVHIRMDFLLLAINQLVNVAAKTRYMYGGKASVPMVVRAMIGKSWGQGAQHSQGLHSFFMHVPGIKLAAPSNPHDAKGCLIAAIRDDDPVLFVEHRMSHFQTGPVPEGEYELRPGKARVSLRGQEVTVVGISYMQTECLRAARYLEEKGLRPEVIDPIWLAPLDIDTICDSVERTGRLLVVDTAWTSCGASAEIVARVAERLSGIRDLKLQRFGFAPTTCPTSPTLEDAFYPNARKIAAQIYNLVEGRETGWMPAERSDLKSIEFKGPF
jgi:pyruvate/2-oxoglutarate/acetoin dehydrogenase E1 component